MIIKNQYDVGKKILGPIFYDFCRKLYLYQLAYEKNAVCFFAYRGGVRLLYLYNKYLKNEGRTAPIEQYDFLTSRICALKGTINRAYEGAEKLLLREYNGESIKKVITRLISDPNVSLPESLAKKKINSKLLKEIIFGRSEWTRDIRLYFRNQEHFLKQYVKSLVKEKRDILFVDTGWAGTTQYFLMKGFPEINWHGVYFGRWDTWRESPEHFYAISGVIVEDVKYKCNKPETAIFDYHHIIEGPLEPKIPSVEQLIKNKTGNICSNKKIDHKMIPPQKDEYIFGGICNYFDSVHKKTIDEISEQAYIAKRTLRKKIVSPNRKEVDIMTVNSRSADFGKKRIIPILDNGNIRNKTKILSKFKSVKKSIWRQGKIVSEFPFAYPILLLMYNYLRKVNPRRIEKILQKVKL